MDVVVTLLPNWLRQRAMLTPDRLALVAEDERLTFAELDSRVDALAASLELAPGEPVGLLMRNGIRYVELVHALMRVGAVLVPLNTRLSADELAWQVEDCRVRRVLHDDAHAGLASELPIASLRPATGDVPPGAAAEMRDRTDLEALHAIVYTSGTTGRPKGALLTYGNHWWSAVGSALNLGLIAEDRWLCPLPLFHVGGLSILFRSVIYGIPVVLASDVNRAIDEQRVSIVSLVATMLQRVLAERGERPFPRWLRCALLGGGPAPRPLLEECARRGVPVVQTYGLTEAASQVATLAPEDALRKLGSAGKPLMPTELRIEDGEIVVRGPTVSPGYWGQAARAPDAWFRTGDAGRLDHEGYLYVLDRRDDLIVSGGENVYPAEVEAVLLAHPSVEEAAVVGRPHDQWQSVPTAIVRLREPTTADALREHCRASLAGYKVPAEIRFVEAPLPRNAAGKLLRRELRR
jgi:O-succinylbenzoic acid--CoA ligase